MTRPEPDVDAPLARRLVAAQFPQWAELPITPVTPGGHDNRTFRLGDELTVRMPSAGRYAAAVEKEHRWLAVLAPQLPLEIPAPVARGAPGAGYPFAWSVYRWLPGEPATLPAIADPVAFATTLAEFLLALARVDPAGGPAPGPQTFFRGGPLTVYAQETLDAIEALGTDVPRDACLAAWEAAVTATWEGEPVWFHGDVAEGNLLLREGRLAAVIDFGTCGVGDPACDVVIAWTLLSGASRAAFRETLGVDRGTWARGRGWALWKALITLNPGDPASAPARRVVSEVLADHGRDT